MLYFKPRFICVMHVESNIYQALRTGHQNREICDDAFDDEQKLTHRQ